MKRSTSILVGCVLATGFGGAAFAQAGPSTTASLNSADPWEDSWEAQRRDREITTRLNADTTYTARVQTVAGPAYVPDSRSVEVRPAEVERGSPWVATSREVWRETDAYTESLRVDSVGTLRRADGGPLPPGAGDAVAGAEASGGLHDQVDAQLVPAQAGGVGFPGGPHRVVVDGEETVGRLDPVAPPPVGGVVPQEVRDRGGRRNVVDRDDFEGWFPAVERRAQDTAADAPHPVDAHPDSHRSTSS